jgi:hypothetical protein
MKTARCTFLILLLGTLFGFGCKKEAPSQPTYAGVVIDLPKFNEAFANASPEILNDVTMVGFGVRYSDPVKSLMALDKLANNPSLTDPQKQIVAKVTEQVKQWAAQKEKEQQQAPPAQ